MGNIYLLLRVFSFVVPGKIVPGQRQNSETKEKKKRKEKKKKKVKSAEIDQSSRNKGELAGTCAKKRGKERGKREKKRKTTTKVARDTEAMVLS